MIWTKSCKFFYVLNWRNSYAQEKPMRLDTCHIQSEKVQTTNNWYAFFHVEMLVIRTFESWTFWKANHWCGALHQTFTKYDDKKFNLRCFSITINVIISIESIKALSIIISRSNKWYLWRKLNLIYLWIFFCSHWVWCARVYIIPSFVSIEFLAFSRFKVYLIGEYVYIYRFHFR